MAKKAANLNLRKASTAKKDEFYTQLSDIENELKHYKKHFKDKVVYYFSHNFEKLGLKKLITTCYKSQSMDF
jgi:hypothetical protein